MLSHNRRAIDFRVCIQFALKFIERLNTFTAAAQQPLISSTLAGVSGSGAIAITHRIGRCKNGNRWTAFGDIQHTRFPEISNQTVQTTQTSCLDRCSRYEQYAIDDVYDSVGCADIGLDYISLPRTISRLYTPHPTPHHNTTQHTLSYHII